MRIATLVHSARFVGVLAVAAGGASVRAQDVASVQPGARVRVFTPSLRGDGLVGTIVGPVRDTLTILPVQHSDTTVAVALSELTRLELRTGQHSYVLRGMMIGLVVGVVGGAIGGRASGNDPTGSGWWSWGYTAREKERDYATGFGLAGALLGAIIGGNFHHDDWTQVRLSPGSRVSVAPRNGAWVSLAYTAAF